MIAALFSLIRIGKSSKCLVQRKIDGLHPVRVGIGNLDNCQRVGSTVGYFPEGGFMIAIERSALPCHQPVTGVGLLLATPYR